MLKAKEIGTMLQFLKDGEESLKDRGFALDDCIAAKTEELIKKFQTINFDIGTVVISSHFCANGGTFTIYDLKKVEESGILDFDVKDNVYKELDGREIGFLIEPSDYGHIEPYNRQQPYYFCGYANLDKTEYPFFNLYTMKKANFNRRTLKRLDKYRYNDYWKMISFDMLIEKERMVDFVLGFLNLYQLEIMSEEILTYINR
jgi:hypothetical protein